MVLYAIVVCLEISVVFDFCGDPRQYVFEFGFSVIMMTVFTFSVARKSRFVSGLTIDESGVSFRALWFARNVEWNKINGYSFQYSSISHNGLATHAFLVWRYGPKNRKVAGPLIPIREKEIYGEQLMAVCDKYYQSKY